MSKNLFLGDSFKSMCILYPTFNKSANEVIQMRDPMKLGSYQNTAMFRFEMKEIMESSGTIYYQMNLQLRDTSIVAVASLEEEGELILQHSKNLDSSSSSISHIDSITKQQLWELSLIHDGTSDGDNKYVVIRNASNGLVMTVEGDTIHARTLNPGSSRGSVATATATARAATATDDGHDDDDHDVKQVWRMVSADFVQFPFLTTDECAVVTVPYDNLDGMCDILDKHGYCIVENVLSKDNITSCTEAFGRDLLNMCDEEIINTAECDEEIKVGEGKREGKKSPAEMLDVIRNKSPVSQVAEVWPPVKGGHADSYLTQRGMSQGEAAWQIRTHPHVRNVYTHLVSSRLHPEQEDEKQQEEEEEEKEKEDEDLCVSTDLMLFSPHSQPGSSTVYHWGHVDINDFNDNIGSDYTPYQSFVSLWDVPADDSTSATVIWPASHKHESRILIDSVGRTDLPTSQHIPIYALENQADKELAAKGASMQRRYFRAARRIPLSSGAMLVWSSRTVHQGWWGGSRLGALVCWEPKSRRPLSVLGRKARYAALGVATTHQGSLGIAAGCFSTSGETTRGENALDILQKPKAMHHISSNSSSSGGGGGGGANAPDFVTLPLTRGSMRSHVLREDVSVTDEEVVQACRDLEASGDVGVEELRHLQSLMKPEIFNAL